MSKEDYFGLVGIRFDYPMLQIDYRPYKCIQQVFRCSIDQLHVMDTLVLMSSIWRWMTQHFGISIFTKNIPLDCHPNNQVHLVVLELKINETFYNYYYRMHAKRVAWLRKTVLDEKICINRIVVFSSAKELKISSITQKTKLTEEFLYCRVWFMSCS